MSFLTTLRGLINDTTTRTARIDASTGSLQIVDYAHHEIHSGSHYYHRSVQTLSINNVLQFTFLTPNTTKWSHLTYGIAAESESLIQVYENVAVLVALTNPITPINNNRNSLNTSGNTLKFEVHATLAAANVAIDIGGAVLISAEKLGNGTDSGASVRDHEMILKQNTLYSIRITAVIAGYMSTDLQWYEHTDKN